MTSTRRVSNSRISTYRRAVRNKDTTREAILGDAFGQCDHPDIGYHWARFPAGVDENGFALYSNAFRVRANPSISYPAVAWRRVLIQKMLGVWTVVGGSWNDLVEAGVDPRAMNPNDWSQRFRYFDEIVNLNSYDIGSGSLVNVRELVYEVPGSPRKIKIWQGTDAATHPDWADTALIAPSSSQTECIPTTLDMHRYILLVFNITKHIAGTYPLELYPSAEKSLFVPLMEADLQTSYDDMSDDKYFVIKAYYAQYGQTTVAGPSKDLDVRQFINVPQSVGMVSFLVGADTGSDATIADGDTLDFAGAGGIVTSIDPMTKIVTIDGSGIATGINQLTGDVTAGPGSGPQVATLATVNSNVGSFTNASITVNGKGLITAASNGTAPVTSVGGTAPIASSGGATPTISLNDTAVSPGSYTNTSLTVDQKGRITAAASGSTPVTSVGGTAPISSSGGATPTISLNDTAVSPGSYTYTSLTVDQKGRLTAASNGTSPVTSVGASAPIASSGGLTPTISHNTSGVSAASYTYASLTVNATGHVTAASNGTAPKNLTIDRQVFTSSGTWTKPAGAYRVRVICIGGGGGAGSGRRGAAGTNRFGGGGGAGGFLSRDEYEASMLGSSETVTIGIGGTGGAARTVNDTSGASGADGGITYFGGTTRTNSIQMAMGGGGGQGGTTAAPAGGIGNTVLSPTFQTYGGDGGTGGAPSAGGNAPSAGVGPTGGGGGGGISTLNVGSNGGQGASATQASYSASTSGGGANGGTANAGAGSVGATGATGITDGSSPDMYGGGSGGSAPNSNVGTNGPNGGGPGGGGGGGSGSLNGNNSGAGGNGADGAVIVITECFA